MRKTLSLLPLLMLVISVSVASGNTITVSPTPVIAGVGPYNWFYGVTLEGDSQINTGDFFTIFDFEGYISGTQQTTAAGWTGTSSLLGTCPAQDPFPVLCAVADDPSVPNLTWTRTGGTILGPGANNPALVLGIFSAQSIFNETRNDFWTSQDQDNQNGIPNEGAGGNTNVPVAPIPEPATLLLLGSGLAFVARMRKRVV